MIKNSKTLHSLHMSDSHGKLTTTQYSLVLETVGKCVFFLKHQGLHIVRDFRKEEMNKVIFDKP